MVENLVQPWTISSKRVAGNHEGVSNPCELDGSVQDLIFPLGIGFKDISVLIIRDDDPLLLISILDDHEVVVGKVLDMEEDFPLFKGSQDSLVLRLGRCEHLFWQENCHIIVTLLLEELVSDQESFDREVVQNTTSPTDIGSIKNDLPHVPWFGFWNRGGSGPHIQ